MYCNGKTRWIKVSREHVCPICGKPDWCLTTGPADAPDAVICARVESPKRVGTKGAGWLHRLRNDGDWRERPRQRRRVRIEAAAEPAIDFAAMAAECEAAMGPHVRGLLARGLGVTVRSLMELRVGWSERHRATTWPMYSSDGHIVGIRLRGHDGRKWAVRGSQSGLFLPSNLDNCADRLLICEGPTDTAALLDLGFDVIGRPSCNGGNRDVVGLVLADSRFVPREVVIVADADEPGERGAWKLATVLVCYVPMVRTIAPPAGIKDARDWVQSGATRYDIERAIDEIPALTFTYEVKGGAR